MFVKPFSVVVLIIFVAFPGYTNYFSSTLASIPGTESGTTPTLHVPGFQAEIVYRGIDFPTSMAFLAPNDILVLEKNEGTVRRIINNTMLDQPMLDLNVAMHGERGMLGIAIARNLSNTYVFVYLTESAKDGEVNNEFLHGRLYRYELTNDELINPKLLLDIPFRSNTLPQHYGGRLVLGPNSSLYLIVGDHGGQHTETQNFDTISYGNGTSVIYRISYDGHSIDNILSDKKPFNKYYAYGIRNGFGIDLDPLTGNLWDTENGHTFGDEINLVVPGFNSGWARVQGIWEAQDPEKASTSPENLFDFGGKGVYSSPQFTLLRPSIGVTAAKFLDSEKYGEEYENDLLVGDFHMGNIYRFDLTKNRTALELQGPLADKVANGVNDLKGLIFGRNFGGITDIQVGPDGYLYVLSIYQGGDDCNTYIEEKVLETNECITYSSGAAGTIFKILPFTR